MTSWIDKYVKCPFYISNNPQKCRLSCESIFEGGLSNQTVFKNKEACRSHIKFFCETNYEECVYYRVNMGKYI